MCRHQTVGVELDGATPGFPGQAGEELADVIFMLEDRSTRDSAVDDVVQVSRMINSETATQFLLLPRQLRGVLHPSRGIVEEAGGWYREK